MITVYGFSPSGNCHKVRLLLGPRRWQRRHRKQVAPHGDVSPDAYLRSAAGWPARATDGVVRMAGPDATTAALIAAST